MRKGAGAAHMRAPAKSGKERRGRANENDGAMRSRAPGPKVPELLATSVCVLLHPKSP